MGKKLDKKAKAAVAKAAKGVKAAKVDKAVKKFRKLEGKLWTREYLLKIAEFDGRRLLLPTALPPVPTPWARLPASITSC